MKTILVKLNPQNDLWMLGGKLPNVSAEAIVDTAKKLRMRKLPPPQ
jgi:hypothetical protein